MATLFADDFNRAGPGLGVNWTEQLNPGGLDTNGTHVVINNNNFFIATANGTSQVDQYVQCWMKVPDVNDNAQIVFRYQDNDNYYALALDTTNVTLVKRVVVGGVPPGQFFTITSGAFGAAGSWIRLGVQLIGNTFTCWKNGDYNAAGEGAIFTATDVAVGGEPPHTLAGPSGILTTGNTGTGASGPQWDGFHAFDGQPMTIYVDANASGQTLGTESDPDVDKMFALHSAGCVRGLNSRIKVLTEGTTPIGNGGSAADFTIGHAGKFAGAFTLPEYSDDTGEVTDPGTPNLIIEGTDSAIRSIFRETQNRAYFQIQGDATGIVFRSFDFDMTGGIGSRLVQQNATNALGAATEHSYSVDKVHGELGTVAVDDQSLIAVTHDASIVRVTHCEGSVRSGRFGSSFVFIDSTNVVSLLVRMNVWHGRVRRGVLVNTGATLALGNTWDVDHNHFVDLNSSTHTVAAVEVDTGADIVGTLEVQNNLMASRGANPMEFGTRITGGVPTGTVDAHHNGYFGIGTNRGAGVTDGGNEADDIDPSFLAEGSSYLWPQTVQSPGITLANNWRPTAPEYVQSADDSFGGVALDRGALQAIVFPTVPVVTPRAATRRKDYCTSITWDPDGAAIDLSDYLKQGGDIVQEKDVLLREYRGADVRLTFADDVGRFLEQSSATILKDPTGSFIDWPNKRVLIQYIVDGAVVSEYLGFVLDVQARRGEAMIRIGNRLQELFQRQVRANNTGLITNTDGETGLRFNGNVLKEDGTPLTGNYVDFISPTPTQGCGIGEWEFTFTTSTAFDVVGRMTGDGQRNGPDGSGDTGSDFTSDSGALKVFSVNWVGTFAAGDVVKVRSVYKTTSITTMTVFREMILSASVTGLTSAEVDLDTIDSLVGSFIDQPITAPRGYVIDQPTRANDALRDICDHMLATMIERARGELSIWAYIPKRSDEVFPIICRFVDLFSAGINYQRIYNEIELQYEYNEFQSGFDGSVTWPESDAANPSLARYGRRYKNPRALALRGYTDANFPWMRSLGQQLYEIFSVPRQQISALTSIANLGIELDQIHTVDSEAPTVRLDVEPTRIRKRVAPTPEVDVSLRDITFLTQINKCFKDVDAFLDSGCQKF
jgi:hypothetical protein